MSRGLHMEPNFSEGCIAVAFLFPLNRNKKKHRNCRREKYQSKEKKIVGVKNKN
jgi:hypothetical protein